jgi:hypothetical protein
VVEGAEPLLGELLGERVEQPPEPRVERRRRDAEDVLERVRRRVGDHVPSATMVSWLSLMPRSTPAGAGELDA